MCIPAVLYLNWELLSPGVDNPFKYLFTIQYRVETSESGQNLYTKGYGVSIIAGRVRRRSKMAHVLGSREQDLAFLAYYIVVFSFVRQALTLHVFRPLALRLGLRKESKIDRFTEQSYAVFYFTISGSLGLVCPAS